MCLTPAMFKFDRMSIVVLITVATHPACRQPKCGHCSFHHQRFCLLILVSDNHILQAHQQRYAYPFPVDNRLTNFENRSVDELPAAPDLPRHGEDSLLLQIAYHSREIRLAFVSKGEHGQLGSRPQSYTTLYTEAEERALPDRVSTTTVDSSAKTIP